jgi:hypothetical protein
MHPSGRNVFLGGGNARRLTYPHADGLPDHNTKHIRDILSHGPPVRQRSVTLVGVLLVDGVGHVTFAGTPVGVFNHLGGEVDARGQGQHTSGRVHPQVRHWQPV